MVMAGRLVFVGTGTDVGKTHVAVAVAVLLRRRGEGVAALKPVETGVREAAPDATRLAEAAGFHVKHPCYGFEPPISPHLAARQAGQSIDLDLLADWVDRYRARWQLVETAGGLLSPLSDCHTNLDLAVRLAPWRLVLVAPNRIGVLHDVTACLVALEARQPRLRERTRVALSAPDAPDASSATNRAELERLGLSLPTIEFPRRPHDASASREAAARLLDSLSP